MCGHKCVCEGWGRVGGGVWGLTGWEARRTKQPDSHASILLASGLNLFSRPNESAQAMQEVACSVVDTTPLCAHTATPKTRLWGLGHVSAGGGGHE